MEVVVKRMKGITFAGMGESGHWVILDTDKQYGGSEGAAKPMELVLMGLGGCSGMEILSILQKMRFDIVDFEVHIKAKQADVHPRVFTEMDIEYLFAGHQLEAQKIEKAIQLSHDKYCSVIAMLKKDVRVNYSYQIKDV